MPYEEKRTCILGAAAVVSYAIYLIVVLARARHSALVDVAYVAPLLWTVGASIAVSILASITVALVSRDRDRRDQRDREIDSRGTQVGNAFIALGAIAALVLAMADGDRFWIANVLYLGFTLAAVVGAATKLAAYRRGMPPW
ncbi:hypothetical protein [Nocardia concava]|uniref:hypothetical protein n=1 Tax=Nocardia concava TaxID=257281 RepID=UPI00031A69F6|nr:hypothetical protein [Nocardia concava]